jgi:hypothetical protein
VCALYWCLPFGRPQGRAVSFAFMLGHFYLSSVAPFPYPWYLPPCALLGIYVLAHAVQDGLSLALLLKDKDRQSSRLWVTGVRVLAVLVLSTTLLLLLCSAYQLRIQQREIEEGTRKQIGLWLGQHAASRSDTVLLESLGYIGFFSQLKMLDVPGLCAPEVVAAEKKLKSTNGADIIPELWPDWLVLRSLEAGRIYTATPRLLTEAYLAVKVFDASERVASYQWLPGRGYLGFDENFIVFKRNKIGDLNQSPRQD